MRFEATMTAKHGIVLAEFGGMVPELATTPGELVTMMTEIDKKIRMVEELILLRDGNSPISSLQSVLAGITDTITRQDAATDHKGSLRRVAEGGVGVRQQRCGQQWSQKYAD